jgi:hypothetical protein
MQILFSSLRLSQTSRRHKTIKRCKLIVTCPSLSLSLRATRLSVLLLFFPFLSVLVVSFCPYLSLSLSLSIYLSIHLCTLSISVFFLYAFHSVSEHYPFYLMAVSLVYLFVPLALSLSLFFSWLSLVITLSLFVCVTLPLDSLCLSFSHSICLFASYFIFLFLEFLMSVSIEISWWRFFFFLERVDFLSLLLSLPLS